VSPKKPGMGDGIGVRSNVSVMIGVGSVSVGSTKREGVGVVNDAESTVSAGGGEAGRFCTM